MVTKHVLISGRVQNVGFRHFTRTNAQKLGLTGWVKNLDDGSVEAVFQGKESVVEEMIGLVNKGPSYSKVADVEIEDLEDEIFKSFEVRY